MFGKKEIKSFIKSDYGKLLLIIIAYIFILIAVLSLNKYLDIEGRYFIQKHDSYIVNSLTQFDSDMYIRVAQEGYEPINAKNVYMPLYPALIKLGSLALQDIHLVAVIISIIAFFASICLIFEIIKDDYSSEIALKSIFFLLIFPTSFFLFVAYSEALFICLSLFLIYFAKKEKWWLVGLFGALASMCRIVGVMLIIPAAYYYLRSKGIKLKDFKSFDFLKKIDSNILKLILIPFGFIIVLIIQYFFTGNLLAYFTASTLKWGRKISLPFYAAIHDFIKIFPLRFDSLYFIFNIAILLVTIVPVILLFKKIKIKDLIFWGSLMLLPICSGKLEAYSRYVLIIYPIFLSYAIGYTNNKSKLLKIGIIFASVISFIIMCIFFLRHINGGFGISFI